MRILVHRDGRSLGLATNVAGTCRQLNPEWLGKCEPCPHSR
jgi:hypothetical protein